MLHQEKKNTKPIIELPQEIQENLDPIMEDIIAIEKEEYHNDLVPFSQAEAQLRESAKKKTFELYSDLNNGKGILKELFEADEQNNPNLPFDVLFARWEEGSKAYRERLKNKRDSEKSLQELCGLSQVFMNRAYEKAKNLSEEKRYEDAACVFKFLRNLNSDVFEYLVGEALALHKLGRFEEALETYSISLFYQPENPDIFFQMSDCLCSLDEIQAGIEALKTCIELSEKKPEYVELLKDANDLKDVLEKQKAA